MEKNSSFTLRVKKDLVRFFDGDLALALWYTALIDYSKRFKRDKHGFSRISNQIIAKDLNLSRSQIRTLNNKLVAKGLIQVDDVSRGGRTFAGYKFLHKK